ncbi:MAG: hypothetical protein ED557_10705 [Balneola sp.]|nr:MAG: hypothetical protein ED557_10705 [Balneola sp.]
MKKNLITLLLLSACLVGTACQNQSQTQSNSQTAQSTNTSAQALSQVQQDRNIDAKVTLVKYSDYQCPACKYFHNYEHQLKEDFGDDINIVVKHFPLSIHPYAHVAARSVEAARKQGKYQEMHDMIFEGQEQWSQGNAESIFIGYAQAIGLNVEQFQQDMNSADMNRIVMADRREGRDLQVSSTPTFFINGDEIENNPPTYEGFKAIVDRYMN